MSDAELMERLRPLVESYARPQAALVPTINALLDAGDRIDAGAASVLANVCGAETGAVEGLLEQYRSFGEGTQSSDLLCFGAVCRLLGAKDVYEHLCSGGVKVEGLAGEVATARCLGHCYAAPVLKTRDGTLHRVALDDAGD
jgi:NADH:ubiquinone oxidoreductase subunit E